MTGGVNDVDEVLVPGAGGGSRGDSDASLLLLSHPIHGGASFMHLPNLVGLTSVEQDTLCACCLHKSNLQPELSVACKYDDNKQAVGYKRGVSKAEGSQQVAVYHLASVNVRHDTNVPICVQRHLSGNCSQQCRRIRAITTGSCCCVS